MLRSEYLKTKSKKVRSALLDEAEKRTALNRKYLTDKLKQKSNLDKLASERKKGGYIGSTDKPRTPYQRVVECFEIPDEKKRKLAMMYNSLNPAQLKRTIDKKLDSLYKTYQEKINSQKVDEKKKISVRFSKIQPELVSVR